MDLTEESKKPLNPFLAIIHHRCRSNRSERVTQQYVIRKRLRAFIQWFTDAQGTTRLWTFDALHPLCSSPSNPKNTGEVARKKPVDERKINRASAINLYLSLYHLSALVPMCASVKIRNQHTDTCSNSNRKSNWRKKKPTIKYTDIDSGQRETWVT